MSDKPLTDEELAKLAASHEAIAPNGDWPDYEHVGPPYMQERQLTRESLAFYCEASAQMPRLIAEIRSHRAAELTVVRGNDDGTTTRVFLTGREVEALDEVLRLVRPSDGGMPGMVSPEALSVLAKLTRGER